MNQGNDFHDDAGNDEIDAALARLPQWQPPADFAVRLAAAAVRQHQAVPARDARSWAWRRFLSHLPMGLATGAAMLVLASLPWTHLAADPMFTWTVAGGAAAAGIAMTLRVLRAR